MKFKTLLFFLIILISQFAKAEDGYKLWLRYNLISDSVKLNEYKNLISGFYLKNNSPTLNVAKEELEIGLSGLLGKKIEQINDVNSDGTILIVLKDKLSSFGNFNFEDAFKNIGDEGFLIYSEKINSNKVTIISANSNIGLLYGVFNFLKLIQTNQDISNLSIVSSPKIKLRVLNHWDNLDRTVERGYAGFSIWDWHRLPDYIDQRYIDYARANASIGINGTVLTNVNAKAIVLTKEYLVKVKALADTFRPYGIRVYLTARFSAPIEIGGLKTADPLDEEVQQWWKDKVKEIYSYIPDFGGFVVKANSEGQPGPQNYNRSHSDGANMLAEALEDFNGFVMWRAFVYSNENPDDRAKQAYNEFQPLDGKFRANVFIQTKNGAIDFQPREPFHPLFGVMPKTPLMMEFQITQEYLGQGTQLAYLSPLYKECLDSDTYANGEGSFVSRVIDGSLNKQINSGIAGVANIGTDRNWTGHLFGQSNWFAFGRLAWNHELTSEEIADEWIKMTFSNNEGVVKKISDIMLNSRENLVNYMTPLGLHHLMGWDHHYGPSPWIKDKPRADWTSVYYHKADSNGIGFDRTITGSNAVSQYFPIVAKKFSSLETCPEEYLLWFHHLNWDFKLKNDVTLWDEMCYRYYKGAETVGNKINIWNSLKDEIDAERFNHVKMLLNIQQKEAKWWRDASILYFQTFSKRDLPQGLKKPDKTLEYYENLKFPFAPGIRPKW
ncbi:MAG: alpha-glucuronidase [Bacteroidetes bacterium]|nr:alpha-glucuronidase [Bacteroidota bacterium]MBU1115222.1 alpha-glucuronidase [Bacteroidota bacterium]MBU1797240.1 alpha-glucuronidase [Bacteroidota bacterium]